MKRIIYTNPTFTNSNNPKTYLNTTVQAGDTSLSIVSPANFTVDRFLQVGETGNEASEIVRLTAKSSTTFTTEALLRGHANQTPIYELRYDQIRIYRTRSEVESLLTTIDIEPGSTATVYYDSSSLDGDSYAIQPYNSYSADAGVKSSFVDAPYEVDTLFSIRKGCKLLFGDTNNRYTDDDWNYMINEAVRDVMLAIIDKDEDYSLGDESSIASGTELDNGTKFAIPSTVLKLAWFRPTYNGTEYPEVTQQKIRNYDPNASYSQSYPKFTFSGNNVVIRPGNVQSLAYIAYPKPSALVYDSDTLPYPLSMYPQVVRNYALKLAMGADKNSEWKKTYEADYEKGLGKILAEILNRQVMTTDGVEIVDTNHYESYLEY